MTIRVAINGFGRIGRNVLRAHYEYGKKHDIEIVAVNSPGDVTVNAHLLRYYVLHFDVCVSMISSFLMETIDKQLSSCSIKISFSKDLSVLPRSFNFSTL